MTSSLSHLKSTLLVILTTGFTCLSAGCHGPFGEDWGNKKTATSPPPTGPTEGPCLTLSCSPDPLPDLPHKGDLNLTAELRQFSSCEEAVSELRTQRQRFLDRDMQQRIEAEKRFEDWKNRPVTMEDAPPEAMSKAVAAESQEMAADTAAGASAPEEFTQTNNQVEAVQEADHVKTNGTHIFQIVGEAVRVIRSWPANEMKILASLTPAGQPSRLLLEKDRLMVVSDVPEGEKPKTLLHIYDVKNPENPAHLSSHEFQGFLYSGSIRIHQNIISLVTTSQTAWPDPDHFRDQFFHSKNLDERIKGITEYFEVLREKTSATPLSQLIPGTESGDCANFFAPENNYESGISRVIAFNTGDLSLKETLLLTRATEFYHSGQSLYLASSHHWLDEALQNSDYTYLHKFDATDGVNLTYKGSGVVDGRILNQFSMDEHEGVLRVATTVTSFTQEDGRWWRGNQTYNHVVTLREEDGSLKILGKTGDLAPGERIYSARFHGNKGYVVTFRQTDPLYTLDLSIPGEPRVVGELKIPGYSSYMHMLDEGHILTVGRDGTEEGRITGLKLSLFNVSDPSTPVEDHKFVLDGNFWTDADFDHKAFTFYRSRGLLAIPVSGYANRTVSGGSWWERYQSKLMLFKVDTSAGIEEAGSLDMTDVYQDRELPWQFWSYSARVSRSIFADDVVYGISDLGIRAASVNDPNTPLGSVSFGCGQFCNPLPWNLRQDF